MLGLGEAYVQGFWECDALDQLFDRLLRAEVCRVFRRHPLTVLIHLRALLFNAQTAAGAFRNGRAHYNLGNDLFEATLDRRMAYSCGYWRDATTLDDAQEAKLDLVCTKLGLKPGMTLLDIGSGWGSLVKFAAERYGVRAVGVTVSEEQARFTRQSCRGLDVEIRIADYRSIDERFDRIASVGMFEHVGPKNYATFMRVAERCLGEGGLFLLHTFASRDSFPDRDRSEVHWINRYIFPGLVVPSMGQIGSAVEGRFIVEDVENFGADYDPTLMAWNERFSANWPTIRPKYGDEFERLWRYYLLSCAGAFRSRRYQVWQFVLSREGVPGGYRRDAMH